MKFLIEFLLVLFCLPSFAGVICHSKLQNRTLHLKEFPQTETERERFKKGGWVCRRETPTPLRKVQSVSKSAPANKAHPATHEVTRARISFFLKQNETMRAKEELDRQLKKHPNDPVFWHLLGRVKKQQKDFHGARIAFFRASENSTALDSGENLYYAAEAEALAGNVSNANRALLILQKREGFEDLAGQAIRGLGPGQAFPPLDRTKIEAAVAESKNRWRFSGTLTSGYDSNVLLLPDASTGVAPGSTFLTPSVQAAYLTKLAGAPFQMYGMSGYSHNLDTDAQAYNNLPLTLGVEWQLPGTLGSEHLISVSAESDFVFLTAGGVDLFSASETLTLKKAFQYGEGNAVYILLPTGYTGYPGVTATSVDVRDGFKLGAGVLNQHSYKQFMFSEYIGYTHQFAKGNNYKTDTYSVTASAGTTVGYKIFASLLGGFSYSDYPLSADSRSDSKYNLGVQLSRKLDFWGPLVGSLGYGYERNVSTTSSAKYAKNIFSLKVSYVME